MDHYLNSLELNSSLFYNDNEIMKRGVYCFWVVQTGLNWYNNTVMKDDEKSSDRSKNELTK